MNELEEELDEDVCCRVFGGCVDCGPTDVPDLCACGCTADGIFCDGAAAMIVEDTDEPPFGPT
jgi:hypothetical protein